MDVVEWYLKPQLAEQEKRRSNDPFTQFADEVEAFLKEAQRQESIKIDKLRAGMKDKQDKGNSETDLNVERKKIIHNYPDLFTDNLNGSRFIKAPPQVVMMNPDFSGHCQRRLTAKIIPKAWQKEASEIIQNMLNSKLIEKSKHHTSWISSTKFVMKNSGKLRLTVDYSAVNKAILRQAHHFPSQLDLLKRIEGEESWFMAKFDLKDSYHQIRLAEESKDLTSFMTTEGTFRFNVTPQGMSW